MIYFAQYIVATLFIDTLEKSKTENLDREVEESEGLVVDKNNTTSKPLLRLKQYSETAATEIRVA